MTKPGGNRYETRLAQKDDCVEIAKLIHELAVLEELSGQLKITSKELERDGFCDNPWFKCVVTECTDSDGRQQLVGYALFYYVYSTFQGRSAYLEDVYISPDHRAQGLGTRMIEKVAQIVLSEGCVRLDFIVLTWNERAMSLYQRLGGQDLTVKEQWHVWRLGTKQLQDLSEKL